MSEKRPKGIIGQWYTLTTDFEGDTETADREVGYTWQCSEVDDAGEPLIDGVWISWREGYRLATPEEIARAKGEQVTEQVTEQPKPSKEAREFWDRVFYICAKYMSLSAEQCAVFSDEAMAEWQKRFEP